MITDSYPHKISSGIIKTTYSEGKIQARSAKDKAITVDYNGNLSPGQNHLNVANILLTQINKMCAITDSDVDFDGENTCVHLFR